MLLVALFLFSICFYSDLFSYIDPGSGSFLIQLLIASVAGSLFFAKNIFRSLKRFVSKKNNTEKKIN